MGFLAAGYKSPAQTAAEVAAARSATAAPIGLNLFVVAPYDADPVALHGYRRSLEPETARFGVELGRPRWDDDAWQTKLELVLDTRPPIVSFTFGCPRPEVLRRLAGADILTAVTVTSVDEARAAVARGAGCLAVQGPGAGGDRGTWDLTVVPPTRRHCWTWCRQW